MSHTSFAPAEFDWVNEPHHGDVVTYRDPHGRKHQLPVRYPDVTATPLVQAKEIRPHLYRCSFSLNEFHFCERFILATWKTKTLGLLWQRKKIISWGSLLTRRIIHDFIMD